MGQNSVLLRFAEPLMAPLREALEAGEELIPRFGRRTQLEEARTARDHQSDIVMHPGRKPKDNPRFKICRKVYCARGDIENRIKELSVWRSAPVARYQSLGPDDRCRLRADAGTAAAGAPYRLRTRAGQYAALATVETGRLDRVIGARIVLHFPTSTPYADDWRRIARSVGAVRIR